MLTLRQAADRLGLSIITLRRQAAEGRLRAKKKPSLYGDVWMVSERAVQRYAEEFQRKPRIVTGVASLLLSGREEQMEQAEQMVAEPLSLPEPGEALRPISWSQLNSWTRCGEAYRLSYVLNVPRVPQGALLGGLAVHKAVEDGERAKRQTEPDFLAGRFHVRLLEQAWRHVQPWEAEAALLPVERPEDPAGVLEALGALGKVGLGEVRWSGRKTREWDAGEDLRWWTTTGPQMLRRYARLREADEAAGWHVVEGGIEVEVWSMLPSGRLVHGYIDAWLFATADGEAILRDLKTGAAGFEDGSQLANYATAVQQAFHVTVKLGQVIYLRAKDPAKMIEAFDLEPLQPIVERRFADFEKGLAAEVFPLKPNKSFCRACSVKPHCAYGRLLEG
jgi:hypothetical protein